MKKEGGLRVISIVPSLTEALILLGGQSMLVGRTRFCTHPAFALRRVPTLGGTKTPDLEAILRLRPDLVLSSEEENRMEDVKKITEAGLKAWVSKVETPLQAFFELGKLCDLLGLHDPKGLLDGAFQAYKRLQTRSRETRPVRTLCLVWKRPFMGVGLSTYAGSLMEVAGLKSCLKGRYPRLSTQELLALEPELVLLPDEPYTFGSSDLIELRRTFERARKKAPITRLFKGRNLFWPGLRAPLGFRELIGLLP